MRPRQEATQWQQEPSSFPLLHTTSIDC